MDARRQTSEASNRQKANEAAWGMVERNWVYFCGFALCLSVLSFSWLLVLSGHVDEFASNGISSLGTIAGILIASLTLLWFCRDGKEHRLQALMPYIPLLCIALIVITWIFGMWEQGFNLFGSFGSQTSLLIVSLPFGASTTLLATLLVVRLSKEVQCGLSSAFIFGIFSALSAGCFLLFTVLQALLSRDEAIALALVLRVIYLVAAALFMMAMSNKTRPQPSIQSDSMKKAFAQRFALTRREADIVGYLLQGFSVPYIAQVECVSINTIKHHMKNIYGKTDVHKREDLLVLIYHATEE
jgi:DNA-binding CsgD family transcriptional regulator